MSDESKWTPTPWWRHGRYVVTGNPVGPINPHNEYDAERIVACVNACAGIADPSVVPEIVEALRALAHPESVADEWNAHDRAVVLLSRLSGGVS